MSVLRASPVPAIVTDRGSHIFCYRSTQIPWGDDMKREFCDGIETLLKKQLSDPELKRKCMNGSRGPHYACVLGHAQQYKDVSRPLPLALGAPADLIADP